MRRKSAVLRGVISSGVRGIKKLRAGKKARRNTCGEASGGSSKKPLLEATDSYSGLFTTSNHQLSVSVGLDLPSEEGEHLDTPSTFEESFDDEDWFQGCPSLPKNPSLREKAAIPKTIIAMDDSSFSSEIYADTDSKDFSDLFLEEVFSGLAEVYQGEQRDTDCSSQGTNSRTERVDATESVNSVDRVLEEVFSTTESVSSVDQVLEEVFSTLFEDAKQKTEISDQLESSEEEQEVWSDAHSELPVRSSHLMASSVLMCIEEEKADFSDDDDSFSDEYRVSFKPAGMTPEYDHQRTLIFRDDENFEERQEPSTWRSLRYPFGVLAVCLCLAALGSQSSMADALCTAQLQLIALLQTGKLRPHPSTKGRQAKRKQVFLSSQNTDMGVWLNL